jgi:GNAT superfamily N-acetyltransferase
MQASAVVRAAIPDDCDAIAALALELCRHQGEPVSLMTPADVRRDGFGPQRRFEAFVAVLDTEVVGYAICEPAYDTTHAAAGLYIADLYVRDGLRGQGLGRALVAAMAQRALSQHLTFVWWASKPWNDAANAFYAKLGAVSEPIQAHLLAGEALRSVAGG